MNAREAMCRRFGTSTPLEVFVRHFRPRAVVVKDRRPTRCVLSSPAPMQSKAIQRRAAGATGRVEQDQDRVVPLRAPSSSHSTASRLLRQTVNVSARARTARRWGLSVTPRPRRPRRPGRLRRPIEATTLRAADRSIAQGRYRSVPTCAFALCKSDEG